MKNSFLSLVSFAAAAMAQAGIPNFSPCGSGTMLPAISATNCGFTDPTCLCKNQSFKEAITNKIPKVCTAATDVEFYAKFINDQCTGQPGYPITIGGSKDAAPAAASGSAPSPSTSSAAAASSPATPASGAKPPVASAGTVKPATFTGSTTRLSLRQDTLIGSVAVAVYWAVLSF